MEIQLAEKILELDVMDLTRALESLRRTDREAYETLNELIEEIL